MTSKIAVAGGTGVVGRHVVDVAGERGHDVVVLARSRGVDLVDGTGLDEALRGSEAVVDVTSVSTQSGKGSRRFFGAVTSTLLDAEVRVGVGHHVALSIVGMDRAPDGYYAGKALQEELVTAGPVPWSLLRANQFHEFAAQMHARLQVGPLHPVPVMRSQPVAAREVAERLVALVEAGPSGRVPDLAGPEVLSVPDMVRRYARATGARGVVVPVPLPGRQGRAFRDGSLTAGPGADLGTQTFDRWLAALPG